MALVENAAPRSTRHKKHHLVAGCGYLFRNETTEETSEPVLMTTSERGAGHRQC